jgi:gamma-glutamylcyclotransferase (GGCT)/AIG2-like uncharacterized protein YtfP
MGTDFVFAYGSNMNRSDIRSWLEANGYDSSLVVDSTPGTVDGYDYVWNYYSRTRAGGAANLEHKDGSAIRGILIEIDESLLKAFDRKEGHPYFYSRGDKRVPVRRDSDGKTAFAWIYLAAPNKGGRRDVWPTRDYRRIVLEAAEFWEFPDADKDRIKAWPTQ